MSDEVDMKDFSCLQPVVRATRSLMKRIGLCAAVVVASGILSGCSTPGICHLGSSGDGGPHTRDVGDVIRPHDSASGNATVRLRVENTTKDSDRLHFFEWRYKRRGSLLWSTYRNQGLSTRALVPGTYDVHFRMKYSTPHRAPEDEPADLENTEVETLKVRW